MAKGSAFYNELDPIPGDNDWVELFNTTNDTIYLASGEWFVTDDLADTTMFELPDTLILPRGFLTVHCDEQDTTITQIHSNFKLMLSTFRNLGPCSQRFIFFVTCKQARYVRGFVIYKPFQLSVM